MKERCSRAPTRCCIFFSRLGGGWKVLAGVFSVVPRGLRDAAYDFIARIRYRIFGKRDELCPIVPPDLRARFDP